jgi:hypothetical protein
MNWAPSAGPSTPSAQRAPVNSSLKRAPKLMSVTIGQISLGLALMSASTTVPGPSAWRGGSLGPDSHVWP